MDQTGDQTMDQTIESRTSDWSLGLEGTDDFMAQVLCAQIEEGDFVAHLALADLLEEHEIEPLMQFGLRIAALDEVMPKVYSFEQSPLSYHWPYPNEWVKRDWFFGISNFREPEDLPNAFRRLGYVANEARFELP